MRLTVASVAAVLVAVSLRDAPAASASSERATRIACELRRPDSAWIAMALDGWQRESSRALHAPPIRYPTLVLFDSLCSYTLEPRVRSAGDASFIAAGEPF